MTADAQRIDVAAVLSGLKDFQRQTVDYAFDRMYGVDRTRRFLVADEVGLGKTLIARGLVAKAIDHLWDSTGRIDIVYICSNGAIARQNINRLNVTGEKDFALASRITLLPTQLQQLTSRKLNFVSFTPSTSFDLRSALGTATERALLFHLLKNSWRLRGSSPYNVFQGGATADSFRDRVDSFLSWNTIEPSIAEDFVRNVAAQEEVDRSAGKPGLRATFDSLCGLYSRSNSIVSDETRDRRRQLIGGLRTLLARTCLQSLQPDLIILDEFQRFKHLLDEEDEGSELARELFNYADAQSEARVLLLSATPYKMYTVDGEGGADNHYDDFLATLRFLQADPARTARCEQLLTGFRRALLRPDGSGFDTLQQIKGELETELRRVIVRTERLAVTANRDGMLAHCPAPATQLSAIDLKGYVALAGIADVLSQAEPMEYWKSAPYLLNFMERYQYRTGFDRHLKDDAGKVEIATLLGTGLPCLLDWKEIRQYGRIDPGNARMRWLMDRAIANGAWRLLWLPPSRPSYRLGGAFADPALAGFTKTLVFSSWKVVPKAISALLSYEAERQIMTAHESGAENTPEAREKKSPLLRFVADAGGTAFTIVYPSFALAEAGDTAIRESPAGTLADPADLISAIAGRLSESLALLTARHASVAGEDEQWYWVAPILLDAMVDSAAATAWLADNTLAGRWTGEVDALSPDESAGQSAMAQTHVPQLRQIAQGKPPALGQPPADLAQVLARMALAAPANAALRALSSVAGGKETMRNTDVRSAAGRIGWGFRNLFNLLESTTLIRGGADTPFWRKALDYSLDGGLDAALEEYAHILVEWTGVSGQDRTKILDELSRTMTDALNFRTSILRVDDIRSTPSKGRVTVESRTMRTRYAIRLGEDDTEEGRVQERLDRVRKAFNSPFWPFVLATTSVGQEGLDFHLYCHAVAHWNLPSNPVDLEQREGRVHRYKGHAVRKNVAKQHGSSPGVISAPDRWSSMFEEARAGRESHQNDLIPYWLYVVEDGAKIERHVPALPLSRDLVRYASLRESLALYRMVFGQPRQEDLVEFLLANVPPGQLERYIRELQIDLGPPDIVSADTSPTSELKDSACAEHTRS